MDSKRQGEELNCYQKLELLNEQLKRLARIMETMRAGMLASRNRVRE